MGIVGDLSKFATQVTNALKRTDERVTTLEQIVQRDLTPIVLQLDERVTKLEEKND